MPHQLPRPIRELAPNLAELYGPTAAEGQMLRYRNALARFTAHFGPGPVHLFRAPGRVNLIGEHTDYNHGYVLPAALDRDILLLARPRADGTVRLLNEEESFADRTFTVAAEIPPAEQGDWSNYARGAAREIVRRADGAARGFDGLVCGAAPYGVPRGAGVSSSSALTVACALSLADFAGWKGTVEEMVEVCSDAEWYVGTRGGVMDHFIALLGARGQALYLDCRPREGGRYLRRAIPLPAGYRLLVVDSNVHHTNVRNEFNQRVAACRAGVSLLRRAHPAVTHLRDVEWMAWEDLEPLLPVEINLETLVGEGHELGDLPNVPGQVPLRVRACCRHVWSENRRVLQTITALEQGRAEEVGVLMQAAHASARDDYRISTPEIEVLVAEAGAVEGCVGARITGAGWGGCIVALVEQAAVDPFQERLVRAYRRQTGLEATVFPCDAGPGAGLVAVVI